MSDQRRVALVTGASKGIGRGIAVELARAGWHVAVNYNRDESGARSTAESVQAAGRQAWLLQADVGYSDQAERMFAELQSQLEGAGLTTASLQLLVNNAGVQTFAPLLELKEEDWDRTLRTNLKGCFLCTQQAARWMQHAGGSIINIGSGANRHAFPNLVDYTASKGGIDNLTRVSAVELGPYGIRVNCVAPGAIEIERTKLEAPDYAGTWGPLTPLRRVGQVDDVADVVVFLASHAARFVTGQTIFVDGGLFSQPQWPYRE